MVNVVEIPVEVLAAVGAGAVAAAGVVWRLLRRGGRPLSPVTAELTVSEADELGERLSPSRRSFLQRLKGVFSGSHLSPDDYDDLFGVLVQSDLGAELAESVIARIQSRTAGCSESEMIELLREELSTVFASVPARPMLLSRTNTTAPLVVLLVGVNGAGKTTTSAKLGALYNRAGNKVLLVAADTFRTAAVEQLCAWGELLNIEVYCGVEGSKPSGVVFDGVAKACSDGFDVVIIDTAGRLHTKANLMQELGGVRNAIAKHIPDAPHDTLLVVDGNSGQNALTQARQFQEAVPLSGVVITKLDGTAKGGIVVAIAHELKIPVSAIGVGEKVEDLRAFDSQQFVAALLPCDEAVAA